MLASEPRHQEGPRTTRRHVVATSVKLAYGTPLVAASFALTGEGALATTCSCSTGSYAIPDYIIAWLKRIGRYNLAERLKGKCVGCASGSLTIPTRLGMTGICLNVGGVIKGACPGNNNHIILIDPACVSG